MIEKVLEERGSRYGKFEEHAKIAQALQEVLWTHPNWKNMPTDSRQSLIVICDKMARMLNGFHDYDDNWVDIIGYATLVLNRIRAAERDNHTTPVVAEVKDIPGRGYIVSNEVFAIPTPDYSGFPSRGVRDSTE